MNKSVLFFIALFSCALCSIEVSKYDALMNHMTNLNQMAGKGHESILALVANVKTSCTRSFDAFTTQFSKIEARCSKGKKEFKDYISKLNGDIAQRKAWINKSKKNKKVAQGNLAKFQADVGKDSKSLMKVHSQIVKEDQDHADYIEEAQEKIIICRQLSNIVTDELLANDEHPVHDNGNKPSNSTSNSTQPAFVEIENKFRSKLVELQSKMQNESKDTIFAPLITTLLELTRTRFANQKILHKILHCLSHLRDNLRKAIKKFQANYDKVTASLRTQSEQITKQIHAANESVEQQNADIGEEGHLINHYTIAIAHIKGQIARKKREANMWEGLCVSQSKIKQLERNGLKR